MSSALACRTLRWSSVRVRFVVWAAGHRRFCPDIGVVHKRGIHSRVLPVEFLETTYVILLIEFVRTALATRSIESFETVFVILLIELVVIGLVSAVARHKPSR